MSFEVKEKDLLARIGRLKTKSGTVETPLLFPVVNPSFQTVLPRRMRREFGFGAIITNAYILKKRLQEERLLNGLHKLLDFDGVVMTDSGAYQILVYGDIEATPHEIVEFQESLGSDIATILDIPTGWKVTEESANQTVNETLKRAEAFFKQKARDDILWVGPVQGGKYLNLVAKSARAMARLPFEIYALGSPTEVMERYRFDVLVDMIMAAKMNLPNQKPLHLFGAGHPFMFALAVALGCDLFDSAAYSLYAKENRYMTEAGTSKLDELEYFPCACPNCNGTTPTEVIGMAPKKKEEFLTEHNLYVCAGELRRIKQAIKDGRLWEHLELRAHSHPSLLQALVKLEKYKDIIERHDPAVKSSGLFYFNSNSLMRPEVIRYKRRFETRYTPPKPRTLLLVPQTRAKPFHKSGISKQLSCLVHQTSIKPDELHVCFYAAPFGIVPQELDEIYPLSQNEIALPLDYKTRNYVAKQTAEYILCSSYHKIILLDDPKSWGKTILEACKKACSKRKIELEIVDINREREKPCLSYLERILRED